MKAIKRISAAVVLLVLLGIGARLLFPNETALLPGLVGADWKSAGACLDMLVNGFRPLADDRGQRFTGKVNSQSTAYCRGGELAVTQRATPWVDWGNYYGTGDGSRGSDAGFQASTEFGKRHLQKNGRGVDGALLDLEYQRVELIKFNLFDTRSFETYVKGRGEIPGPSVSVWDAMRLPPDHPRYAEVGGDGRQVCRGDLVRYRTLQGICNDIFNPAMGSSGSEFARNVQFEETFAHLLSTGLQKNRHSDAVNGARIGLLKPDPQLISRLLFTRRQKNPNACPDSKGRDLPTDTSCDYLEAPHLNLLAAFWIQFNTHDWFSHTDKGLNSPRLASTGCYDAKARELGCRSDDRMQPSLYSRESAPRTFSVHGDPYFGDGEYLERPQRTTRNQVTAWWDASQIYGFDADSGQRVLRDPDDRAKLRLAGHYLPLLEPCPDSDEYCDRRLWAGQESVAFPDNWNIGLSFFHNLFAREHNYFVDKFRERQGNRPDADSGLRNPLEAERVISYREVGDDQLYQVARLVVAAEIAKIHTIEWTPQLLYNEPLFQAMYANWFGLLDPENDAGGRDSAILEGLVQRQRPWFGLFAGSLASAGGDSNDRYRDSALYSIMASGSGIVGLGSERLEGPPLFERDRWSIGEDADINGGVNHFGSPFNFTEEFTAVYRLHPLVPDLVDYRRLQAPNEISAKVAMVDAVRDQAAAQMRKRGIGNWALSMGRQRMGALRLHNQPRFLQKFTMPHLRSKSGRLDIVALDIIRDRERGIPRYNEFRRQIGLQSLTGFDDFIDRHAALSAQDRKQQRQTVELIREIYGTHVCDKSKIISGLQRSADGEPLDDCLGRADGSLVDNIEDLDTIVGWLAESTRPHGFAISETQFQIFVINASRRLFSDRFFTSSFRPEFYSRLGYDWVRHNGLPGDCPYPESPLASDGFCYQPGESNGHRLQVSPLKRILLRNIPELTDELRPVVNAFDPWARDPDGYYSLAWKPRARAADDPAFSDAR